MPQQELSFKDLATDFLLGGVFGAVSKTFTAPIERVKLVIQSQNANPKIRSGKVPRYTGIWICFSRIYSEQRRRGLLATQLHELLAVFSDASLQFVLQGFDQDNVPELQPEAGFRQVLRCEHGFYGLAAAGSFTIVYPLDYARTRLASDVGSGKKTFNGLVDCFNKTAVGLKGFFSLYAAFGVSLGGIIPYRGF